MLHSSANSLRPVHSDRSGFLLILHPPCYLVCEYQSGLFPLQIYDAAVGCAVRIQPDNTRPCHEGSPDDGFQLGAIGISILWTRDRHVSNFLKLNMLSSIVLSGLKRKYVPGVA